MSELPNSWCLEPLRSIVILNEKLTEIEDETECGFVPMNLVPTKLLDKLSYEVKKWSACKKGYTQFRNGDVLLAKITPCFENGKSALASDLPNGIGAGSTEYFVLRGILLDGRFLHAFVKSKKFKDDCTVRMSGSVGHKRVPKDYLLDYPVPLPPLNEQTRIANKLDSLLAKVDQAQTRLERIPKLLKRFRQSVLAAATSGELTREWRKKNNHTTLSMLNNFVPPKKPARYNSRNTGFIKGVSATAVGKPDEIDVSSWEWVPLVDIALMGTGHTPSRSKPEYWGGEVCWIGIKDARHNHASTIFETEQKTNELGLANSAARILPENTVCISRTASVGYVVKMGKPMATSQDFVTWTPTEVLDADWLKWLFVGEKESLFRFGKGTTHTTVYFPEWLSMHVALPPLVEQKEIVRRVESLFAMADTVEKQYQEAKKRIDRLTQSLLAKAFRGELVPQDSNDEPAVELLKRIQAEREKQQAGVRKTKAKNSTTRKTKKLTMKLEDAPATYLLDLLAKLGGEAHAEVLWKQSELSIDDFYAKLKQEMTDRNIVDHNPSADPSLRKLKVA